MKRKQSAISRTIAIVVVVVVLLVLFGAVGAISTTSTSTSNSSAVQTTANTRSLISSATSQTSSSTNDLYFQVSCAGCSGPFITNTSACNYRGTVTSLSSWNNRTEVEEHEYAGEYDTSSPGASVPLEMTLYGNGTQEFSISVPYRGQLLDWVFEQFTCYGTLSVSVVSSNGSTIWQGSTNSSFAYVIGSPPSGTST
ncbi:MAG: hypothetical protein JRN15_24035 [Nitrososphaerota archaeon]|nr:hypothetical protein [Nitrososphaerota archaeon]